MDFMSLHSAARCLRSSNEKLLLLSRLKKTGDWAFAIEPISIRTLFNTRLKSIS